MTKSAIKKYTERLGFFGMILHYIGRFMTKTEQQVIGKLTVRFGKVKKNRLVFKNREMMDCTDNPEAFYEYLISSGYNKKYEIIWLVSEKRKFRNQNTGNVKFVTAENKYGWSSPLAYYYGATAGFFFYSHNSAGLNRYRCKGQTVVNLWHGCGYKDAEQGKKKQNIKPDFDYALVPGPVFVKTKSGLWNCEPDRLLMMGYPRYDWMLHPSMSKDEILDSLFGWKGKKAVLWMPTFRKSDLQAEAHPRGGRCGDAGNGKRRGGERLYWRPRTQQWTCRQCGMWSKPMQPENMAQQIVDRLYQIQQHPEIIHNPKEQCNTRSIEVAQLDHEIHTALALPELDADAIIDKILRRAELQFNYCAAGDDSSTCLSVNDKFSNI